MSGACRTFRDRVHALVDGEVESDRAGALRAHAHGCAPCQNLLYSARRLAADLDRASAGPAPEPPTDLVSRIMSHLPRRRSRQPLWIAVGGTAAAASAATVFVAALARALSGGGLPPLAPGLHAVVDSVGGWLARFGALFEALGAGPGLPTGSGAAGSLPPLVPALALIATGLLGLAAALALGALSPARKPRTTTASS